MKGKNLIITAILVLAAGIALLIMRNSLHSEAIVTTGGILFIVAGLLDLLVFESGRRKESRRALAATFNWITTAAAVILGLCMLIFRATFVELIPFMFGILVAFAAFYQVYLLAYASRPVMLPGWLYIAPLLIAGAAVYLFFQDALVNDPAIMIATGSALTLFGVVSLIEGAMLGHYHRHPQLVEPPKAEATAAEPKSSDAREADPDLKPLDSDPDTSTDPTK